VTKPIEKQREPGTSTYKTALLLAACIAAFGAVRLLASFNDFYIDEIWSFYFTLRMRSVLDVFMIRHDNNHILNTAYMYLAGGEPGFLFGRPEFIRLRLLSVLSGTASLGLLWLIARKRGRIEAFTAVVLAGLSYPLVIYSSEARGYAPAIFFALLSFIITGAYLKRPRFFLLPLLWVFVAVGFLFHSSFIYVYLALGIWSLFQLAGERGISGAVAGNVKLHAAPLAFVAALYFFFLRGMTIGGGAEGTLWGELQVMAGMITGLPGEGAWGPLAVAAVLLLCVTGLAGLYAHQGRGKGSPVFYLSVVFITPAVTLVLMKPELIYFRYFLVIFPFIYLLAASSLASLYGRPGWGRPAFTAVMAVFILLNLAGLWRFYADGRGHYYDALKFMVANSPEEEILIGSDHDFRNKMTVIFYAAYFDKRRIAYIDTHKRKTAQPGWMIVHSLDLDYRPQESIYDSGNRYDLKKSYGYAGVSGWSWFIYRKAPASP